MDDPNPQSSAGVSNPPVYRTIQPPPWPYWYPDTTTTSSTTAVVATFITWQPGPPGPICRSGCGLPCLIFCNCFMFPPGFSFGGSLSGLPGPPGPPPGPPPPHNPLIQNFQDPDDPNSNPTRSPTQSCTVSTFSSCQTYCVASPTSSCTSTCSLVVGCDTTGTRIATTVTPAPSFTFNDEEWGPISDPGEYDAGLDIWSGFSAAGSWALTTPTPGQTSSPTTATPTPSPTSTTVAGDSVAVIYHYANANCDDSGTYRTAIVPGSTNPNVDLDECGSGLPWYSTDTSGNIQELDFAPASLKVLVTDGYCTKAESQAYLAAIHLWPDCKRAQDEDGDYYCPGNCDEEGWSVNSTDFGPCVNTPDYAQAIIPDYSLIVLTCNDGS